MDRMGTVLNAANGTRLVVAVLGPSAEDAFTGTTVTGGGSLSNVDVASILDMAGRSDLSAVVGSPGACMTDLNVDPVPGMVGRLGVSSEVWAVDREGAGLDSQVKVLPAKELLGNPVPGKRVVLV